MPLVSPPFSAGPQGTGGANDANDRSRGLGGGSRAAECGRLARNLALGLGLLISLGLGVVLVLVVPALGVSLCVGVVLGVFLGCLCGDLAQDTDVGGESCLFHVCDAFGSLVRHLQEVRGVSHSRDAL